MLAALILALLVGKARQLPQGAATSTSEITTWRQYPQIQVHSFSSKQNQAANIIKSANTKNQAAGRYTTTLAFDKYKPRLEIAAVDPSNYGERFAQDINGVPVKNQPIVVIHETSDSAASAVNFFQTPHTDENVQASYHAIIKLDGTVLYLVPPEKRAFGAANSVFVGSDGEETVQTNPNLPPSVNNFAYHVSLETPLDGRGNNFLKSHSGYTEAQYNSLAWLIAQSQVPEDRITTHKIVDRSNQRVDPLSFDSDKFLQLLNTYRQLSPVYRAQK
ncbi:hypothetical protein NSMS1_43650 [Nostoc sp. MS1]|nr:hypothetical protein NSMS1_43650 [Nostoc sp. MS1]